MAFEVTRWDIHEVISTTERQVGYLEAPLEDGDPALISAALGAIARARGMSAVVLEAGITREGLDKALSSRGDPRLSTVMGVTTAPGLRLSVHSA